MVLPGLGALVGRFHNTLVLHCAHNSSSLLFDNTAESRYRGITVIILLFFFLRVEQHDDMKQYFFNQQFYVVF